LFVAWTEIGRSGHELSVTRFRAVDGALGEGATIVTGIPVAEENRVPLWYGRDDLLYIAIPSSGAATDPYEGAILRFTRDGRVPPGNRAGSPVFALPPIQTGEPFSIGGDTARQRVWFSARRADGVPILMMLSPERRVASALSEMIPGLPAAAVGAGQSGVTVSGTSDEPSDEAIYVAANGVVNRAFIGLDDRASALLPLRMEPALPMRRFVPGAAHHYAFADSGDPERWLLLRFDPQRRTSN
jgi:hypothetical protein